LVAKRMFAKAMGQLDDGLGLFRGRPHVVVNGDPEGVNENVVSALGGHGFHRRPVSNVGLREWTQKIRCDSAVNSLGVTRVINPSKNIPL
jgi:hypothetical protein